MNNSLIDTRLFYNCLLQPENSKYPFTLVLNGKVIGLSKIKTVTSIKDYGVPIILIEGDHDYEVITKTIIDTFKKG